MSSKHECSNPDCIYHYPLKNRNEKSYFPILVRYIDNGQYMVCKSPQSIESDRGYKVICHNIPIKD